MIKQATQPMLTVLMPVYNAGPYVKEAIDSILRQTYGDFEFLIINDGSTDCSLDVIKTFSDPRIVLVEQENIGLIASLNKGLRMAKGRLIARMDADDICLPERLQIQLDFLKANPQYIVVGGEADAMDKEGNFLLKLEPIGHSHEEIESVIDIKCPFIHPCVIFVKDLGGYPDNALTFEDHLLWKKALGVGKVCNLRQTLVKVRFNPESVTIDERWRGGLFLEIRKRSLETGFVRPEDVVTLKELIASQNFLAYKQASYYAMVGKKYLWNNPNKKLARKNFITALKLYPKNRALYVLLLLTFMPKWFVKGLYSIVKTTK
jgi:glycosyltransferase involved in cell wall biosynthesis